MSGARRPYDLTVLVPVFNEAANLRRTFQALEEALGRQPARAVEVLFVDDGSTDASIDLLRAWCAGSADRRLLLLSRNHGLHTALFAGFEHASAPVVVTMEAHAQHDVADVFRFADLLDAQTDLVAGHRVRRNDPWWRLLGSRVVNGTLRAVCGLPFRDVFCLFRAWRRDKGLQTFSDPSFSWYLASMLEGRVKDVDVDFSHPRKGRSAYSVLWLAATAAVLVTWALRLRLGLPPTRTRGTYTAEEVS